MERLLRRTSLTKDDPRFKEVLLYACSAGYKDFVAEWVQSACSELLNTFLLPSKTGISALTLAAENGKADIVKYLLHLGADRDIMDCRGRTALWYACDAGDLSIIQSLIRANVKPNQSCNPLTAIFQSVVIRPNNFLRFQLCSETLAIWILDHIEKFLLELDPFDHVKVRLLTDTISTVLEGLSHAISSSRCNDQLITHFLMIVEERRSSAFDYVRLHPYLFTRDPPLYVAASQNRHRLITPLLRSGISSLTDVSPKSSKSALYVASERGYLESVRTLIQEGARVSSLTSTGRNSLHAAVERGHTNVVELLCKHANTEDIMQLNSAQVSPFTLAENRGRRQMVHAMLCCYQRTATPNTMSAFLNSKIAEYASSFAKNSPPRIKRTV